MSRFADIFEAFSLTAYAKQPEHSPLVTDPTVVVRYDEDKAVYDVYQVSEDANMAALNPAIEWNSSNMLWFFFDIRDGKHAAHIEFLSEYQPKLRVGKHLAQLQRF